jgi:hypothetical protein
MLSPARLTQLMMELIFILLGALVVWLGAAGHIYFDRRGVAFLIVSLALIVWGLMAFARPVQRWNLWEKWNRGVSLVLLGLIMLGMTRVPFLWVPKLLIVVGAILVTRGLFACVMIFKQA